MRKLEYKTKIHHALAAESLGTFALTFVDAGIAILNRRVQEPIPILGKCLAPAFVITSMIFAFGGISGAHFNPAVTLAFMARGDFPWRRALPYMAAQTVGAAIAAFHLQLLFGDELALGLTAPRVSLPVAAALESLMAGFLVLVVLATADEAVLSGKDAALAVGITIAFCGLLGKAATDASLNPARSLGVALVTKDLNDVWLYILMPSIGASAGAILTALVRGHPSEKEARTAKGGKCPRLLN